SCCVPGGRSGRGPTSPQERRPPASRPSRGRRPMRKNVENVATFMVASVFCVGVLCIHSSYLGQTGKLPGEVETLKTSGEIVQHIPKGEAWHIGPAYSSPTGVKVVGPLGPDGKIVPRFYYTDRGPYEPPTRRKDGKP